MAYRYWSDLHLRHANIIKYCNRPFETVEQMDEALIGAWKQTAEDYPDDKVICLGDLTLWNRMGISKIYQHPVMRLDLPKQELLVLGNHDNGKLTREGIYDKFFKRVVGSSDLQDNFGLYHEDGEHRLILSHAPLEIGALVGDLWNAHGHVHDHGERQSPKHLNCSVEVLGYFPRTLHEVITLNEEFYDRRTH